MSGDVGQIDSVVAPVLRQLLRRRYRLLAQDHDDLVQQTLEDLLRFVASRSGAPLREAEWPAVGVTILKRRIADRFREATARASISIEEMTDVVSTMDDPYAIVDAIVQYRTLLATVLRLVAQLPSADQALLLEELDPSAADSAPMSSTTRKHLSRLRQRLRQQLESKFGVAPEDVFGR